MRRSLHGLVIALGLALALPAAQAQPERPNPRNIAAMAEGKTAIAGLEQQLAQVRATMAEIEAGGRESHAHKVLAIWLEGQIALGRESFEDKGPKALPVIEAKAAEAKTALSDAFTYKDRQRTDLSTLLSNTPIDKRADARPEFEAVLNGESLQHTVAGQLAGDFDTILQSLKDGTPPYALFNARKQMNEQASAAYADGRARIVAASEKLKILLPPPA